MARTPPVAKLDYLKVLACDAEADGGDEQKRITLQEKDG